MFRFFDLKDNRFSAVIFSSFISLGMLSMVYFLYYFKPMAYLYLIAEDLQGEYVTAVCYILSSVFVIWAMAVNKELRKPGYFLLALVFLFIGMEEISWGQRLLGLKAPYAITRLNYQSEFNLHNIIDTHIRLSTIFNYAVLIWIFILPFAVSKSTQVKKWVLAAGIPQIEIQQAPFFIAALFFTIFQPIIKGDEVGELFLGIAFILFATDTFTSRLINKKTGSRGVLRLAVLLAVVALAQFLVFLRPSTGSLRWHLNNLAVIEFPSEGLYAQSEALFQHALKDPSLRSPDTLFSYSLLLKEMESSRSEAMLRLALEEQYGQAKENPDRPEFSRNAGKVLTLLNQAEQANVEFQKAVRIDQKRFDSAQKDWQKVTALMSLGRTYTEMKEYKLAEDSLKKAHAMASERQVKMRIDSLINQLQEKAQGTAQAGAR